MNQWTKPDIDVGTMVDITAVLTIDDVPSDAASVILRVRNPGGQVMTPVVTHDGLGLYSASVEVGFAGKWTYRFESVSPVSAHEGEFLVRPSQVLIAAS